MGKTSKEILHVLDSQMKACGLPVDKRWKAQAYAFLAAIGTSIMACYYEKASPSFNWWARMMSQVKWTRHHKTIGVQPYEPESMTLTEMTWHAWTNKKASDD